MKLRDDGTPLLSAGDLARGLACSHLTQLDHQLLQKKVDKPGAFDPFLTILAEQGRQHEAAYLAHLETTHVVARVNVADTDESALEQTKRFMREGAAVIYQARLLDKDGLWGGAADFLIRVDTPSDLGDYSYKVIDTKLSSETRAGTVLQLCLYSDLVAEIQGHLPEHILVVTPVDGFQELPYRVDDYMAYYRLARRNLTASLTGNVDTYPEPVEQCDICRWRDRCEKQRRNDDHLCLVAGISRSHRAELNEHDIGSLEALATAESPLPFKPKRGSRESLARVQHQAQLQLRGRLAKKLVHELVRPVEPERGFNRLPAPSDGDVFLDLEGDPFVGTQGLEYLFGWCARDTADWQYHALWAVDGAQEKLAFEQFIDAITKRVQQHPDLHIYHYAPYEPSALKRLCCRYGTRSDELDALLRAERFVDLYGVVRQGVVASVESYSIKALEPLIGFTRAVALPDVGKHKRGIEGVLQLGQKDLPEESSEVVRQYNEDDCRAALALRDWLEGERQKLIDAGEPVTRPELKSGEANDKTSAWLARIKPLEDALLDGLPVAREERDDHQQARFLLAHMLRWHRREMNVKLWERFRLMDMDHDDLLDEGDVVTGLQFERQVDPSTYDLDGASPVRRYRFPPQELNIRAGSTLKILAEAFPDLGTVMAIKPTEGWVDLEQAATSTPQEAERGLGAFKDEVVRSQPLDTRIEAIARKAVDDGLDIARSNPLAAKLLLRTPLADLATHKGDAWNGVLRMDGDVLPVQGPPGSGKSYAGARMIILLVQQGKKVGITANSHAVIENLMRAVAKAAPEMGVAAPRMLRADKSGVGDEIIEVAKDNKSGVKTFRRGAFDILGGTAWLWAAEAAQGLVDTLFVDEAGQMSLTNVVACTGSARNLVLLGDPQQLAQPTQASHPEGTDVSALEHLLDGHATISADRGLFLEHTYRMHPSICTLISELYYERRLHSAKDRERQAILDVPGIDGSGLRLVHVDHSGNSNRSVEEVSAIVTLCERLLSNGRFTDSKGETRKLANDDILIVAPFNNQVAALREALPNMRVGTVDKFQGQEAPIVIYGMTSSSIDDAPRGMEFLFDPHRFNVAISRAQALTILVATPALLSPAVRTPRHMQLANTLIRYAELAT